MSIIKVENLTKVFKKHVSSNFIKRLLFPKYKKFKAVDSISFEIEKGEIFGLLGPNGAGKTTTILMLSGLEYPTAGIIHVNGLNIKNNFNQICGKFNVLFSDKLLYNRLTAFDNLVFYANLYTVDDPKKRAEELLNLVDLIPWKDQYVENFSLGMRMKLALARALVNDPEILYLDEPTLGLDVKNAEFVRKFLQKLDCTILLTTHYLNEAIMLCNRIGVLQKGRLVHVGTPEDLKKIHEGQRSFLINTNDNQSAKKILADNPLVEEIIEKNENLEINIKQCNDFFEILNDLRDYKLYQFQELKTGLEGLFEDVDDELGDNN
ncbi:MAG: ABC transporter ATP-binding protein, partial [Candidatus Helarchaeota archaeon]|nr:ABC transporter ATP-binding protein [Candidatus Helarchaeota archaeon]